MWKIWVIWVFLVPHPVFLLSTQAGIKQDDLEQEEIYESVHFDDARLKQYSEDPDFDYSQVTSESWWSRLKAYLRLQWSKFITWLFGEIPSSGLLLFIIKALPYLILLGVLFFFLWLFYRMNPGSAFMEQPNNSTVFASEEEAIVQSQDIDKMIEQALLDNNYKLAIRYQYLLVLQFLSKHNLITFQTDKTNADYAMEIEHEYLKGTFLNLSRIYDYTWYGNFEANLNKFNQMKTGYLELIKSTRAFDEKK